MFIRIVFFLLFLIGSGIKWRVKSGFLKEKKSILELFFLCLLFYVCLEYREKKNKNKKCNVFDYF